MVGEIKKGRYIYYHCTGYKGKCPEPYTREEVLGGQFTSLLKGIAFSAETLVWVRHALRESNRDERQFHDDAIAKLKGEHRRLQDRVDAMYMDKLDGRIGNDFFDAKAGETRAAQAAIMRDMAAHQTASRTYIEEGVQLVELAQGAHVQFESQPPAEKRKLLNFVLSNCTWKGGELTAKHRQPFDVLAVAVASEQQRLGGEMAETARNDIWLPSLNPPRSFSRYGRGVFSITCPGGVRVPSTKLAVSSLRPPFDTEVTRAQFSRVPTKASLTIPSMTFTSSSLSALNSPSRRFFERTPLFCWMNMTRFPATRSGISTASITRRIASS